MIEGKNKVKQDNKVHNTQVIFGRVMCLLNAGQVNLEKIFDHELDPVLTALFDETGNGRYPKNKSDLKKRLQVKESNRIHLAPDVVILDGCAILWSIHWPKKGNMLDFIEDFNGNIFNKIRCLLGF